MLQNETGPAERWFFFFKSIQRGGGGHRDMGRSLMYFFLANQKKAGVPECKPDDFFCCTVNKRLLQLNCERK